MAVNALTARRMYRDRLRRAAEQKALSKRCTSPVYWELHRGIMDLRTGNWIAYHKVKLYKTYEEARRAKNFIDDPWPDNVMYIVRRYRHGNQNTAEAMEGIR